MKPGPRPKPALQVVREGNPSKKAIPESVVVPPAELVEPDWFETWPAAKDEGTDYPNRRSRGVAAREWARVVPVLQKSAGLGALDANLLTDYCVCVARIDECEREISTRGLLIHSDRADRGWVRNPATTVVGQYRIQLARYIGELGLSPSARTRLAPMRESDDGGGDPFSATA